MNDRATVLGGLVLNNGVTNANLYSMVEITYTFETDFYLQGEDEVAIQKDQEALQPGNYHIVSDGAFLMTACKAATKYIGRCYYSE